MELIFFANLMKIPDINLIVELYIWTKWQTNVAFLKRGQRLKTNAEDEDHVKQIPSQDKYIALWWQWK